MFLNKLYDWIWDKDLLDVFMIIFLLTIVPSTIAIIVCGHARYFLWLIPFAIIFGEWAYIDYIKKTEKKLDSWDVVSCKLGYMLGTCPFVIYGLMIWIFRKNIIEFLVSINFLKTIIIIICILVAISLVIGYFWMNVMIAKKYKKYKK